MKWSDLAARPRDCRRRPRDGGRGRRRTTWTLARPRRISADFRAKIGLAWTVIGSLPSKAGELGAKLQKESAEGVLAAARPTRRGPPTTDGRDESIAIDFDMETIGRFSDGLVLPARDVEAR